MQVHPISSNFPIIAQMFLSHQTDQDCSKARCYNPNEEFRLRRVIDAIGKHRFEIKIRALGQRGRTWPYVVIRGHTWPYVAAPPGKHNLTLPVEKG